MVALAAYLTIIAIYLIVSAFEPIRMNWGDPWSDGNALTSGRYFSEHGFIKLAFTPILDVGPITQDSLRYTHYPPLPDIVNGTLRSLFGLTSLAGFRLFAIAIGALGLWFFYRVVATLWTHRVAQLAVCLMASNFVFLQYIDTLHHVPLYTALGWGALLAALRWLDTKAVRYLALMWFATVLCFLASYDYYFFCSILILVFVKWRGHRWFGGRGLALILLFGTAAISALVIKNLLVIWAVGFAAWKHDIIFQFFERATANHANAYKEGLTQLVWLRTWRLFSPVAYVALFAQLLTLIDRLRGIKSPFAVDVRSLWILAAGVPFLLVFTQLVAEQYHPMLLLVPYVAIAVAALAVMLARRAVWLGVATIATYAIWQLNSIYRLPKSFLPPRDLAEVQRVLRDDPHPMVLSNILVDGPVRYWFEKHLFGLATDRTELRFLFEQYGETGPFTLIRLRRMGPQMMDKGVYAYFSGDRRWAWIGRPDYYRVNILKRFALIDKSLESAFKPLGVLRYESPMLQVRQVTLADLDAMQVAELRERVAANGAERAIDFETFASEVYKHRGFSTRRPADSKLAGHTGLQRREPAKLTFTLQGYRPKPLGEMRTSGSLLLPVPSGARIARIRVSSDAYWLYATAQFAHGTPVRTFLTQAAKPQVIDIPLPSTTDEFAKLEMNAKGLAGDTLLRLHHIEFLP